MLSSFEDYTAKYGVGSGNYLDQFNNYMSPTRTSNVTLGQANKQTTADIMSDPSSLLSTVDSNGIALDANTNTEPANFSDLSATLSNLGMDTSGYGIADTALYGALGMLGPAGTVMGLVGRATGFSPSRSLADLFGLNDTDTAQAVSLSDLENYGYMSDNPNDSGFSASNPTGDLSGFGGFGTEGGYSDPGFGDFGGYSNMGDYGGYGGDSDTSSDSSDASDGGDE